LEIGIRIRRRFLENAKKLHGIGAPAESIIEASNAAAHRGYMVADYYLISLKTMNSMALDSVFDNHSSVTKVKYQELFGNIYGYPFEGLYGFLPFDLIDQKGIEIHNLTATIISHLKYRSTQTASSSGNKSLDRFDRLARDCCILYKELGVDSKKIDAHAAFQLCPRVEQNLQEIRGTAEMTVGSSKGRQKYQMCR